MLRLACTRISSHRPCLRSWADITLLGPEGGAGPAGRKAGSTNRKAGPSKRRGGASRPEDGVHRPEGGASSVSVKCRRHLFVPARLPSRPVRCYGGGAVALALRCAGTLWGPSRPLARPIPAAMEDELYLENIDEFVTDQNRIVSAGGAGRPNRGCRGGESHSGASPPFLSSLQQHCTRKRCLCPSGGGFGPQTSRAVRAAGPGLGWQPLKGPPLLSLRAAPTQLVSESTNPASSCVPLAVGS